MLCALGSEVTKVEGASRWYVCQLHYVMAVLLQLFFVFSSFRLLGTATIVVGVNSYSKLWKKWEFITYTLGRSFISFLLSLSQR